MTERVFIAIPSAHPDQQHTVSLTDTMIEMDRLGMRPERRVIHGNCYVHLCRDLLTHQFMNSGCSHLFFWDDDVAGPPSALPRLIAHDRDIIVAPYPKKVDPDLPPEKAWPYVLTDGIPDASGLLECDLVATGFLLIKRHVIEALYKMRADQVFWHDPSNAEIVHLFPTGFVPGLPKDREGRNKWWGEDFAFSAFAKQAGFKMWLDPTIPLIHAGRNIWRGNFAGNADRVEAAA